MMTESAAPPAPLPAPASKSPRLLQLDFLRGIAILLVLCFHGVISARTAGFLAPVATRLNRMGWIGVDLFFVLSGFLIGGLLFQEYLTHGQLDVKRFLVRRAFKIWPSYYLYLLFVFVWIQCGGWDERPEASRSLVANLLHIQNYTTPPRGHTWSLAVEEHFYLVLPFLLTLLIGRGSRTGNRLSFFPWIVAAVAALCLFLRYETSFLTPWRQVTHYFPTQLRMDSLFFGVLLAYFYHLQPNRIEKLRPYLPALFVAGLVLILPAAIFDIQTKFMSVPGFSILYVGFGCILLAVIMTPIDIGVAGRALGSPLARGIAFIGFYSYPIYLWHIDCATLPLRYLAKHGFLASLPGFARYLIFMAIYVLITTAVGFLIGRLIEKPALRLRDRLFPSLAKTTP